MDQSPAPLLDALADYHRSGRYGFTPPGHRQGRGTDPRVLAVLGTDPFRDDLLATAGLDDRMARGKFLSRAEELMADAVGADTAFFSTCGSSLSVKAAMMAVASDHRRILATMSFADDKQTADRLITAITQWRDAANGFEHPPRIDLPSPADLQLDTVALPRDAFFGKTGMVPAPDAAGRIAAEQITPYPPGIPAVVPGERLNEAVIDYLRSGVEAGMTLPDPADPTARQFRVVA
jgi:arginine/lysine/ornithine decarboxylase